MTRNIIIENATIVTPEGRSARKGEAMASVKVIENATLVARDGKITFVGPMAEMPQLQKEEMTRAGLDWLGEKLGIHVYDEEE